METKFVLRYSGPAVESGLMDVYDASANMIAFSEFVVVSAKHTFGESVEARAQVAGFGRGSFETDLVFQVAGASATILSTISPSQLWTVIKEAFALWKHLKGHAPTKVERKNQGVEITNNDGQVIQVMAESMTVVFSEKGSGAVGQFVHRALEQPGMDSVEIAGDAKQIGRITQSESRYFVPVSPSETITDVIVRMGLIVEAPVFKDGNKWRFSDGQQSFYASIEDREFLARVDSGERFGKGDVIYADVRISQQQAGMKLSAERIIMRVHEHKTAPHQYQLE